MKILIADDEKQIRTLFKMILSSEYSASNIDVAVNGAEAVDAFRAGNYDVLLLDIHMPVKDGYQACLEIQEICRQEKREMPFVIFCTGFGTSKEIQEITADKTHFALLYKPVTCDQIIDTFKAFKAILG
jgi:CheY-like chemotaxis protein